jgi:hypothetical protein
MDAEIHFFRMCGRFREHLTRYIRSGDFHTELGKNHGVKSGATAGIKGRPYSVVIDQQSKERFLLYESLLKIRHSVVLRRKNVVEPGGFVNGMFGKIIH